MNTYHAVAREHNLRTAIQIFGLAVVVGGFSQVSTAADGRTSRLPGPELNLRLTAPIATWDEAIPLGNGILGGLLWGEGNLIRLSLDRGDLWDERPAPGDPLSKFTYAQMVKLVGEKKNAEISRIADAQAYDQKHPTKIPAGRLEITLDPSQQVKSFELNLATAEGRAWFTNGGKLEAFFCAAQFTPEPDRASRPHRPEPLALVRIPGPQPKQLRLRPPASVKQLGYPDPKRGTNGTTQWFLQEAALGLRYCVAAGSRRMGDSTLLAITVLSSQNNPDPVRSAHEQITQALDAGYDQWLTGFQFFYGVFGFLQPHVKHFAIELDGFHFLAAADQPFEFCQLVQGWPAQVWHWREGSRGRRGLRAQFFRHDDVRAAELAGDGRLWAAFVAEAHPAGGALEHFMRHSVQVSFLACWLVVAKPDQSRVFLIRLVAAGQAARQTASSLSERNPK